MTNRDIKYVAEGVKQIYNEKGYDEGRRAADQAIAEIIRSGRCDDEAKSDFRYYSGFSWEE